MNGLFFPIAKLAWNVLAPANLLLWLALAAAVALIAGRPRLGRGLAIAAAVLIVVFGVLPTGEWLAQQLEDQYPRPAAAPAHIDGILNLGGGLGDDIVATRGAPATRESEARLVSTYELARRYPDARVVFSGGWGRYPDTAGAAYAFAQMGLDPKRLILESRSRDTFENLLYSRQLVRPKPGETWVLATSAIQMPRAMLAARRLGWDMIPWPTDYQTAPPGAHRPLPDHLDVVANLYRADNALHEDLGLLAYQLRGAGAAPPSPARNAAAAGALSNAVKEPAAP